MSDETTPQFLPWMRMAHTARRRPTKVVTLDLVQAYRDLTEYWTDLHLWDRARLSPGTLPDVRDLRSHRACHRSLQAMSAGGHSATVPRTTTRLSARFPHGAPVAWLSASGRAWVTGILFDKDGKMVRVVQEIEI